MMKKIFYLLLPLQCAFGVATNSMNNNNSSYIMNGGVVTYPNGDAVLSGSRYTNADSNHLPLQENPPRDGQDVNSNPNTSNQSNLQNSNIAY
jgi:hypothetical protein